MSRTATLEACVSSYSATSAAALAAPAYGSGTNAPFAGLRPSGAARRTLIKAAITGAGTGNVVVTIWYCDPTTDTVWIADDVALGGVWTVAYAATTLARGILVDNHGFDIGVSVVVSAVNITAVISATAGEIE